MFKVWGYIRVWTQWGGCTPKIPGANTGIWPHLTLTESSVWQLPHTHSPPLHTSTHTSPPHTHSPLPHTCTLTPTTHTQVDSHTHSHIPPWHTCTLAYQNTHHYTCAHLHTHTTIHIYTHTDTQTTHTFHCWAETEERVGMTMTIEN